MHTKVTCTSIICLDVFMLLSCGLIFLEIMNKMYIRPIIKQMDCFGVVGQHTSCSQFDGIWRGPGSNQHIDCYLSVYLDYQIKTTFRPFPDSLRCAVQWKFSERNTFRGEFLAGKVSEHSKNIWWKVKGHSQNMHSGCYLLFKVIYEWTLNDRYEFLK